MEFDIVCVVLGMFWFWKVLVLEGSYMVSKSPTVLYISLTPRNPPIGGFQGFGALDIFLKPTNWGVSSRYGDDYSTTKKCHVPNFEMCNVIANKLF